MAIGVWMYGVLGATQDSLLREPKLLDAPFGESHPTAATPPITSAPPKPPTPETPRRKKHQRRAVPRRP